MDVARSALEHAERADPIINAFALLDRAGTLAGARESEERWRQGAALGPLDGMPVAIKEFAAVRCWPAARFGAHVGRTGGSPYRVRAAAGRCRRRNCWARRAGIQLEGITDSPAFGITAIRGTRRSRPAAAAAAARRPWPPA